MLMFSATILVVTCLQLGVAQPLNDVYMNNGQNGDWYRNNERYYDNGEFGDGYQGEHYVSEWPEYRMCPPSMDEVGRATWTFMHSVAAMYPENPTEELQGQMSQLLELINQFYPYPIRHFFYSSFMNNKPNTSSRRSLNQWMCSLHNAVNEKLGKPVFNCKYMEERWRNGSCN